MVNNGRCSARWMAAGLIVVLFAACGERTEPAAPVAGNPPTCDAGMLVQVDLAAWQQRIEAMTHWPITNDEPEPGIDQAPDYTAMLSELGLQPLPDRSMEAASPERAVMALTSVEITLLRRGTEMPPDHLLAARFSNADGAQSLRVQVLRPVAASNNTLCALGDALSHEKESGEEPCNQAYSGSARSIKIVPLVAADHDAIAVHDAGGWCGAGGKRGDKFVTSYWGVENAELVQYFQAVTFESWYQSPYPPAEQLRGKIVLSDDWPKTIELTRIKECLGSEGYGNSGNDCSPYQRSSTYHYADGQYTAQNH